VQFESNTVNVLDKFNFPFLCSVNGELDKSRPVNIVLWCHGSYLLPAADLVSELSQFGRQNHPRFLFTDKNVVLLTPILPRLENNDAQILERATLTNSESDVSFRPDREVLEALGYIKAELQDDGFIVNELICGGGISAGACFINRMSILHPEIFARVAIILAGFYCYPTDTLDNFSFNYPMGTADLSLFEKEFKPSVFESIDHFIYVGAHDDNPGPLRYESRLGADSPFLQEYEDLVGEDSPQKTQHFANYLIKRGMNVQLEINPDHGHNFSPSLLNQVEDFFFVKA